MHQSFDVIFIGTGISTAYTLVHLLDKLRSSERGPTLKILFIEKADELWAGVPYGKRSGKSALLITPLKEFLPNADAPHFLSWLNQNDHLQINDLPTENKNLMDLHIPRDWFGRFMKKRMDVLLKEAVDLGYINYQTIHGEAIDLHTLNSGYQVVTVGNGKTSTFIGEKIVLAIGSPPPKPLKIERDHSETIPFVINDVYEYNVNESLMAIEKFLSKPTTTKADMLIIGSNASALDIIYHLNDKIISAIGKIHVLSSSGEFPYLIDSDASKDFVPLSLTELLTASDVYVTDIFNCFISDLDLAKANGFSRESTYVPVNSLIVKLINRLSADGQKEFVYHYGPKLGMYYRRAGVDYYNKAMKLYAQKKLELIKGKFLKAAKDGFSYLTAGGETIHLRNTGIIVNCSGSVSLMDNQITSCLLRYLIDKKLCKVNQSGKGFVVNENFEAAQNLYIMGPLLAGNIIGEHKVWHAESCKRIYDLTVGLSDCLLYEKSKLIN